MKDELNDKAAKLYAKYAAAIEFIYNNKPDAASELYSYFEKQLISEGFVIGSKNKGYIRFTTDDLDKKIPKNGTGWPGKEAFMFEIDYFWSDKNVIFKAVISPCDDATKTKIKEAVSEKSYYKKPIGEKWVTFYTKSFKFKASEVINEDDNEIEDKVSKIIEQISPLCKEIASDISTKF